MMKRLIIGALVVAVSLSTLSPLQAFAFNGVFDRRYFSGNDITHYNPESETCSVSTSESTGGNNRDYAGREILSKEELTTIATHQPTYEQAAKEAQIPWQMIAVIHLRETRLSLTNPSNGQGIYQDYARINGPYPPGPVDAAEFLRQTRWAAQFLKNKATKPELLASADEGQVKDAFFGYNGRAGVYEAQARSLGFTEAYEGSPYVMNIADAKRDPAQNPNGWGQIKTDGGGLVYPANNDYGAFVVYGALAGAGSCNENGELANKIVEIAEREYELWRTKQLNPGNDYQKYTYGASGDWCAWFVSWVLKEAGSPVNSNPQPFWASVSEFVTLGPSSKGYKVVLNDGSYKPEPGDLAVYGNNDHMNIVIGMQGEDVITIGGNEGAGGNGSFTQSSVKRNVGYGNSAIKYITVK